MSLLKRKIIVIGGSAAGPAAAAKAKRVNPENEVILYEAGSYISIGTCEIPYLLTGEVEKFENLIFFTPESFEKEKGVKVKIHHRVEFIDKHKKKIFVRNLIDNKVFEDTYDKLILCTGSIKKVHPNFRNGLKNVFYLKTLNDVITVQNFVQNNKINSALVIGAGYTGLEALEFVKKIATEIYLVDVSEFPLPGFDIEVRKILLDKVRERGINFIGNVNEFRPYEKDDLVKAVQINKERIDIDFVLITIGFEPNNSLAMTANLALNSPCRSIKVDDYQKTSDDNIYAAGDCCGVKEYITRKTRWIPLATIAHNQGHVAGANASGESEKFHPVVRNIAFRFFDINVAMVGLTIEEIEINQLKFKEVHAIGNSKVKIMPGGEKHFVKIKHRDNGKIISANLIGGSDIIGKANLISLAIKNEIPITKFYETDYAYTPTLSNLIETLSILGKKSR